MLDNSKERIDILFRNSYSIKETILISSNETSQDTYDLTFSIPTYNRDTYLFELLESINNLVDSEKVTFEVVITDNTREKEHYEIIKNYLEKCRFNYRYYKNLNNLGGYGNWNQSILLGKGNYYVLVHDDDLIHSQFLTAFRFCISQNVKFDAIAIPFSRFFEDSYEAFEKRLFDLRHFTIKKIKKIAQIRTKYSMTLGWIINRDTILETGLFPETGGHFTEDQFFATKMIYKLNVYEFNCCMYGYRTCQDADSMKRKDLWNQHYVDNYFLKKQYINLYCKKNRIKEKFLIILLNIKFFMDLKVFEKTFYGEMNLDYNEIVATTRLPLYSKLLYPLMYSLYWGNKKIKKIIDRIYRCRIEKNI